MFDGYENFTFNEVNYEITEKDVKWLEKSGLPISHTDLEKIIDTFEKIVAVD